jgi:hypothetical protein
MSLLITRNNASDPPESYHNYLRDTFEVPPHSEIAVHTCIINRDPTYVIKDTCVFYVYHGGYLSDHTVTTGQAGKEAYMQFHGMTPLWVDQPIRISVPAGDYSLDGFAQQVQSELNYYDFHPSFQGRWTCEVARAADGSFNGFQIQNVQRGLDASSAETGATAEQLGGLLFAAGTQRLTRNASGVGMKVSRLNSPLNGAKGAVVFNVDNIGTGEDWAIGLRRNYFDAAYVQTHDTRPQMDFMVYYESNLGLLQYWEYSWDTTTDKLALKSLAYQGSDYVGFYDFKTNTDNIKYIKFELNNQKVTVSLGDNYPSGPNYKTLTTSYKAVGYATYVLYPAVGITEENKYATIDSFNRIPDHIIPTSRLFSNYHKSDIASLVTLATQQLVSASDATALDLHTVLIVGDALTDYLENGTAMDELGFDSAVGVGSAANPRTITFTSNSVPDMISTDVLHVRVSALDVRTYNGVQSGISKILYTLPRFSNGVASGRMHITPHEKTYLALNNTNTLFMNDIAIEFVNSDESLATDLTDKAMVIFHIKQGKHGGCGCGSK